MSPMRKNTRILGLEALHMKSLRKRLQMRGFQTRVIKTWQNLKISIALASWKDLIKLPRSYEKAIVEGKTHVSKMKLSMAEGIQQARDKVLAGTRRRAIMMRTVKMENQDKI